MDIDELLKAARAGESWAGLAIVTHLMPTLINYAEGIAGDLHHVEREQAVEQAVLRSVQNLDRFEPARASFETWVRGYVRFAIHDIRRTKAGFAEDLVDELPVWLEARSEATSDTTVPEVVWPLLQLQLADQVIIQLRHFEELPFSEIAQRIGGDVTVGALRVRYHRALKRLRQKIEADPDFESP